MTTAALTHKPRHVNAGVVRWPQWLIFPPQSGLPTTVGTFGIWPGDA